LPVRSSSDKGFCMRARAKRLSSAAEVLGASAGRMGMKDGMRLCRLARRWHEIVGTAVAGHAAPVRVFGKTLLIRVEHPAWMQELGFLKQKIIERVRLESPESGVSGIRFEVGSLDGLAGPPRRAMPAGAAPRELSKDDERFIEGAVGEIRDDEIRAAARRAMEASIVSRTKR
jgi:predicted nucleic acid-binding Zn ribbon protein